MKTAGKTGIRRHGRLVSFVIVAVAIVLVLYALHESRVHPTTSDSSLDADVVHVAAAVGGRILELAVAENARVAKGDLLFQIDPFPYQLAVAQAEADLQLAEAQLDSQRRLIATQTSAAVIAGDETKQRRSKSRLGQTDGQQATAACGQRLCTEAAT